MHAFEINRIVTKAPRKLRKRRKIAPGAFEKAEMEEFRINRIVTRTPRKSRERRRIPSTAFEKVEMAAFISTGTTEKNPGKFQKDDDVDDHELVSLLEQLIPAEVWETDGVAVISIPFG